MYTLTTVTVHVMGKRIYIRTAIDHHSRLLYARAYKSNSSASAAEFLERLHDFVDNRMQNVHTDNGSEFHDRFQQMVKRLEVNHWWSRVDTPKDNALNERVNRTLQEEFVSRYRGCQGFEEFQEGLADWVWHYNHERPHAALGYRTPFDVAYCSPNPRPRLDSSFDNYDHRKGRLMTDDEWRAYEASMRGSLTACGCPDSGGFRGNSVAIKSPHRAQ